MSSGQTRGRSPLGMVLHGWESISVFALQGVQGRDVFDTQP